MNPVIYKRYRDEHLKNEKAKVRQSDLLNHILGSYIAIGVNDPKKYPDKPRLAENNNGDLPEMTDDEMERQARRNTIRMGGTINDSR